VRVEMEPRSRWPQVLVVMPSFVEDVKVAERSGMVVVLLKNGNALSLNPQVVKRLARAGQPEPGSVWDRVRGMLGR
jgi:hypothetical protein